MCEIAKQLGHCPLDIEEALTSNKWCKDYTRQARCGNEVNKGQSTEQINFKGGGRTHGALLDILGVRMARRPGSGPKR